MRVRLGNPFADQHGLFDPSFSLRIYEFVTHSGTNPHDVAVAIEQVVPALAVYARGSVLRQRRYDPTYTAPDGSHWIEADMAMPADMDKAGWVNGAVWTSWREDERDAEPALLVSIGLYNRACSDPYCLAGHMNDKRKPVHYRAAPALADWQLDAIKEEIGEHPIYRLRRRDPIHNAGVLSTLGFTPLDAPLLGSWHTMAHVYTALDYLARTSGPTFAYKALELTRQGYPVDVERVRDIAIARHADVPILGGV